MRERRYSDMVSARLTSVERAGLDYICRRDRKRPATVIRETLRIRIRQELATAAQEIETEASLPEVELVR